MAPGSRCMSDITCGCRMSWTYRMPVPGATDQYQGRLRMVREDTMAPSEGASCALIAVDEAVGCTRAFLRCGSLLDDWSVEGILSLVFVCNPKAEKKIHREEIVRMR
ncbi:UNVERIFIED_CONTAM: hypothetical protein NCL1_16450 [Trichonephila clavipes]